jgi:hypothetical protein
LTAAEETGGVESGGDLESFEMKSEMTRDDVTYTFYKNKNFVHIGVHIKMHIKL